MLLQPLLMFTLLFLFLLVDVDVGFHLCGPPFQNGSHNRAGAGAKSLSSVCLKVGIPIDDTYGVPGMVHRWVYIAVPGRYFRCWCIVSPHPLYLLWRRCCSSERGTTRPSRLEDIRGRKEELYHQLPRVKYRWMITSLSRGTNLHTYLVGAYLSVAVVLNHRLYFPAQLNL